MDKLLREGNSLYVLHEVFHRNRRVEFNKFYIQVTGDRANGINNYATEEFTKQIETAVNSYDELTQQNEGLRKDIEGMSKENEKDKALIRRLQDENERLRQRIDEHIENSTK